MSDDILLRLQAELDEKQRSLVAAQTAVQELKIAIAAIVASRTDTSIGSEPRQLVRKQKRGALKRAVLDCIRSGRGTVGEIYEDLLARRINTSRNSISNTIQRLQTARVIHSPPNADRWLILADEPRLSEVNANNEGSANEAEPSQWNGAAGLHPAGT